MWGFTPSIFAHLREQFGEFLRNCGRDEKAEFYIPAAVNRLVGAGQERVKVLHSPDVWLGITHREDCPRVAEGIRRLVAQGKYPQKL